MHVNKYINDLSRINSEKNFESYKKLIDDEIEQNKKDRDEFIILAKERLQKIKEWESNTSCLKIIGKN